jgi:Leucine-rich repeat (LRR) protein
MLHVCLETLSEMVEPRATTGLVPKKKPFVSKESTGVYLFHVKKCNDACSQQICEFLDKISFVCYLSITCRHKSVNLAGIEEKFKPTSVSIESVRVVDLENMTFEKVKHLAFVDAGLKMLPASFPNFSLGIITLDLSANDFSTLEKLDLSHMTSVQVVVLRNCKLRVFPVFHCGGDPNTLVKVDLSQNMITSPVLGWIHHSREQQIFPNSVKQLHLNDNEITEFPLLPENIEYLYVSNNPAKQLSQPISFFKKLKYVSLCVSTLTDDNCV